MTNLEKIQKAALARLEAGEDLEHILQDYADYEEELRPVLEEAAGVSLSSLMNSPRPKAKVKAKNESKAPVMPVMLAIIVALGAAVFLFLGYDGTPTPEPTLLSTLLDPTTTPVNISQVQVDTSYCSALGRQSLNAAPILEQQAQQQTEPLVDIAVTSVDYVTFPTASPAPTMASLPPVVEAPVEDGVVVGGSSSTSGGGDGGGMPASTGAEADSSVERESSADSSTVSGGIAYAPTGEAYGEPVDASAVVDERGIASSGEEVAESAPMSVANQAVLMPLNAGEIDDNADWDTYQEYRRNFLTQSYLLSSVRDLDTTDRQIISVVDSNGLPVLGACVQIYYGESFITASSTYATGLTLFFPNLSDKTRYLQSFRVVVSKDNVTAEATLDRTAIGGLTSVTLPITQTQGTVQLDVMFLLDATGSMGDEIAQLQTNILSISSQLAALPNQVDVRFGLVSYRDRGDEYVTHVYDFTNDVQAFQANLMGVVAGGGGDYPESLNEGFYRALNDVTWRGEDTIKLVILVADAPPHVDYANDADYSILMQDALARGIKVHPIASSGLQPEGEYILRQIGQYTMGHFLFLTYDGGVAGTVGEDRPDLDVGEARDEQGVGDYSVEQLDELVLHLITDEIAALQGQ